jgi:hypothetical protein
MAGPTFNLDAYSDALVVLGTAAIVVPIVQRWRVSPVLGYLVAGVILGPLGLGSFKEQLRFLHWVTVVDAKNVAEIAELGVVFLMFLIGMELSYERLLTMRRLVFGLGSLQVVLSAVVIGGIAAQFGNGAEASIIIGLCLALSSTAIVIEVLSNQRRLTTTAGRTSFSILLFQDLAVVPILLLVSILGASQGGSLLRGVGLALLQAAVAKQRRDAADRSRGQDDLQAAQSEHQAAHGDEALERELEADEEQQEDDAELGEAGDVAAIRDGNPVEDGHTFLQRAQAQRPQDGPGCQVAEHRAHAPALHDRHDDAGGGEHQQRVAIGIDIE